MVIRCRAVEEPEIVERQGVLQFSIQEQGLDFFEFLDLWFGSGLTTSDWS